MNKKGRSPVPGFAITGTFLILFILLVSSASAVQPKATTCETSECHITITINLAFVGGEADPVYMAKAESEIETEWGYKTYGDCKCPVEVVVNTKKVDNCSVAPSDHHCIEVTDFRSNPPYSKNESAYPGSGMTWEGVVEKIEKGEIDPHNSNFVKTHRGYMNDVTGGEPVTGWWSDAMGTEVNGQQSNDFAHEAGHLMGLEDGDGGIMSSGTILQGVTQQNVNDAVENVCGSNACPDRCCCGNRKVDRDKGEKCDPLASPDGCETGKACCPVCCNCYSPSCEPQNGEYATKEDCENDCGENRHCYKNYYTGCWDCIERVYLVFDEYQNDTEAIWKADEGNGLHKEHIRKTADEVLESIRQAFGIMMETPFVSDIFGSERINLYLGEDEFHVITENGELTEAGRGWLEDNTMNIYIESEVIRKLSEEGSEPQVVIMNALGEGKITYEGVGFFGSLKSGMAGFLFNMYFFFTGAL